MVGLFLDKVENLIRFEIAFLKNCFIAMIFFQAHPPIHPTKYVNNLSGNEHKIYEYIVRHFLACVSKDAVGHETVVHVDVADEKFVAKGLFILEKNYLEVYIYDRWNAKEIHEYQVGDTFTPTELNLVRLYF